jgi:hypothetical protein
MMKKLPHPFAPPNLRVDVPDVTSASLLLPLMSIHFVFERAVAVQPDRGVIA